MSRKVKVTILGKGTDKVQGFHVTRKPTGSADCAMHDTSHKNSVRCDASTTNKIRSFHVTTVACDSGGEAIDSRTVLELEETQNKLRALIELLANTLEKGTYYKAVLSLVEELMKIICETELVGKSRAQEVRRLIRSGWSKGAILLAMQDIDREFSRSIVIAKNNQTMAARRMSDEELRELAGLLVVIGLV